MMSVLGLVLITMAWGYQAYYTAAAQTRIRRNFVFLYVVGSTLLVVEGIMSGTTLSTMLNAATALLASLVIIRANEGASTKSTKTSKKSKKR